MVDFDEEASAYFGDAGDCPDLYGDGDGSGYITYEMFDASYLEEFTVNERVEKSVNISW